MAALTNIPVFSTMHLAKFMDYLVDIFVTQGKRWLPDNILTVGRTPASCFFASLVDVNQFFHVVLGYNVGDSTAPAGYLGRFTL